MEPRRKRKSAAFNPIDVHVGNRVKIRRKLLGMSQTVLGDSIGLTFQQVQKYERGANRISASRLFELSQVLDVPVAFFFDDMPEEIAGRPGAGTQDINILGSSGALELVRAYIRIPSRDVRRSMRNLAKAIAKQ